MVKKFSIILMMFSGMAVAQEMIELHYAVSYIAASIVYINAGREGNIAVGDTAKVYRSAAQIGIAVVSAVSKKSSSAQILSQRVPINVGDDVVIRKMVETPDVQNIAVRSARKDSVTRKSMKIPLATPSTNDVNIVSGRVGIQYIGALAEDSRLNLSQPSVLVRASVQNLYNTGLVFSLYGRTYYDLSDIYRRYNTNSRLNNRMYDFSLQTNDPAAPYGFGIGRMSSEFVGGMGIFDGGQAFYRYGNITSGFLYGAKVQDRIFGVDPNETKGAFFVNAKIGPDFLHQYSGTLAYGQQLVKGKLDREFLYLQNFLMLGSSLSLYESSEIELNDINNGVKKRTFKLSNTFLSVNYYPVDWISTNIGFDGTRTIYLFETMKSFSDTLLDKNLMQGYRAGTTFRLPYFMSLSGNISYRTKKGDARDAHTISGTFRISDIVNTEIGAGIRYADIVGVYSNGSNITVDIDKTLFSSLSLAIRYDYYKYTILTLKQTYTTHTATINSNYRFSRFIYSSLAVDGIMDNTMNSVRVYAELGVRF